MYWIRREQKWLGVAGDAQHGTQKEQQKEQQKTSRSLISTKGLACKKITLLLMGEEKNLRCAGLALICRSGVDSR